MPGRGGWRRSKAQHFRERGCWGCLPPPVVVTSVENRLPPTSSSRMCTEQMPGESAGGKALCSGPVWIWFCFKWKLMEEAPGLGHLDNGPALLHCGMKTGV